MSKTSSVKFPFIPMGIAVVLAAVWGYTHRAIEPAAPVAEARPVAPAVTAPGPRSPRAPSAARVATHPPPVVAGANLSPEQAVIPLEMPEWEKDSERDANPAAVQKRDEEERSLHALQHGGQPQP